MTRRISKGRPSRRDAGQSLVEFVLALPILLVIIFGIVEFGVAWRTYQVITNVAREGARYGVIGTTTQANVQNRVDSLLQSSGLANTPPTAVVTFECNGTPGSLCGPGSSGAQETVQIQYQHTFVVLGPVLDLMCFNCGQSYGTVTLTTRSTMRNE